MFILIKSFRNLLEKNFPDGTNDLDKSAIMEFSGDLYAIDGEISYARATIIGGIISELTDAQKQALQDMETELELLFENPDENGDIEWPSTTPTDLSGLNDNEGRVLVSTYASQLYSWYLGSVEGDTYFCPERHGTYFGSFYMKDIPPISATEAITIDSNLTADMGTDFLNSLNTSQKSLITDLVDIQKSTLDNIVVKRTEISEKLRLFMSRESVDKDEVLALIRQYGEYDGEIIYNYAVNFTDVGNSLSAAQESALMALRINYYSEFTDYQKNSTAYDCTGAWLYAEKLSEMIDIDSTDFLFTYTSVMTGDATLTLISDGFSFAEGPASDSEGIFYFSDILENIIYKWSENDGLSFFRENSGGTNGLYFYDGNLIGCEGSNKRIVSMDSSGNATVLADTYSDSSFNEPNDLWVTPDGGIYFTDPLYFGVDLSQGGEYVYYISPDRTTTTLVIDDLIRPNGITGSSDGSMLYVTDHGGGATYQYTIETSGLLSDKQLFASVGGDGMTMDSDGNLYICEDGVLVYDSSGNLLETIEISEPTNVCFGGTNGKTLLITTKEAVYSLSMNSTGAYVTNESSDDDGDSDDNNSDDENTESDSSSSSGMNCFINSIMN